MYDTPLTIEQNLAILAATPARLAELSKGLRPAQLLTPPEPGEWSARDVLAHLRACGDMWGKYIAEILSQDRPTIKAVNPTTWIKQTNYRELEFGPSLRAFSAQRRAAESVKAAALGCLVSYGDRDKSRQTARTNGSHVRHVAGEP